MKTVKRNCCNCHTEFLTRPTDIRRGHGKYCSRSCSTAHTNKLRIYDKTPNVKCAYCDKEFYMNRSKQQNSKSGLFFCCREHKDLAQRLGGIQAIQPSHYGNGEYAKYRLKALAHLPHKCNRCGYDERPILIVHHIDYDRSHNDVSNLEILCPNCRAVEHRCSGRR